MNRIAKELKMVASSLVKAKSVTASAEIDFAEIPEDRVKMLRAVFGNQNPVRCFEGMNGYIVVYSGSPVTRLTAPRLKKLINNSFFRWLDGGDQNGITIGC